MKILMTGGTGLVGRALGKRLVKQGHIVHSLVRDPLRATLNQCFPAFYFKWNGVSEVPPLIAFQDVDAIIHLAGEGIADQKWSASRKTKLRDSRIKSTELLSQAIHQSGCKPKVYIGASAVGIYGDQGEKSLDEKSELGQGFLAQLCREWEEAHLAVPAQRHVILRFGVVLSDQGGFLNRVSSMFQKLGASALASGEQYLSWIHINDLLHIINSALLGKVEGVVNATAPEPVTNEKLTQYLANSLKVMRMPSVPSFALKLLYGEMSQVLLEGQRVLPEAILRTGFKFDFPNLKSALKNIYGDHLSGEARVVFEIWLNRRREDVFNFFCDEKNLEKITPKEMGFKVLRRSTDKLQTGTLIDYGLKIHGVPARWQTLIEEFELNDHFVDSQLKGPYSKWRHLHAFSDLGGGTLMRDVVIYKLPMGILGQWFAAPLVNRDVQKIFSYRSKIIGELFGGRSSFQEA